jgi:hypothetical protein
MNMSMQRLFLLCLMLMLVDGGVIASPRVLFSTYLGGGESDQPAGDMFIDKNGNIYITGPTKSADFPVTKGAFDTSFNDRHGMTDAFVAKLDPCGNIIWSTFIGTPTRDDFYSIKVDEQGYVYLAGAFGPGAPTTPNVVQRSFAGPADDPDQWDGYLAKLSPDGSRLVWATYLGTAKNDLIRSMDMDSEGNLVVATGYRGSPWPGDWFSGSFQPEPRGGEETVIIKISADARRVLWASYLGGSGDDSWEPNVAVNDAGQVHVYTATRSANMPVTPGAHGLSYNGEGDIYIGTLSADGTRLLMGTYLGTDKNDGAGGKRGIAIAPDGALVVSGWTESRDFPVTDTAAFSAPVWSTPWGTHGVTARFSPDGKLLAASYAGDAEGLSLDSLGNVYITTFASDDGVEMGGDAFQAKRRGGKDGALVVLAGMLDRVLYASYLGGSGDDAARISAVGADDNFYVTGMTESNDMPLVSPTQGKPAGSEDIFLVRFSPLVEQAGTREGSQVNTCH